jgi:YebC/PmpR family DNA-binding regulatory protein
MAGHSKWANIKRRKGAQDQKRGKLFSKLSKHITIAAKSGGDPDANLSLKYAIQKAKEGNMPNDTIAMAIKKGTGEIEGLVFVELLYEGFAPGGVALIVEALSDKRTRTTPEIKKVFDNRGANLGAQGSVSFMFDKKGLIVIKAGELDPEELHLETIDMGVEEAEKEEELIALTTGPKEMHGVLTYLEENKIEVVSSELAWIPQNTVSLSDADKEKLDKLVELLEDHDDVQNVFTNAE